MMRRLVLILAMLSVVGCVTKEVGKDPAPEANDKEAAQINLQLGVNYYRQGNIDASRDKLEKAIVQDPNLAAAYRMLGLVYQSMGDLDEADEKYLRSVKLASSDPDTLNDYAGFLCFERGEVDRALEYFDKAIRVPLNENRNMLYSNGARCAMTTQPEKAEDYLRTALSQDPENAQLMIQMADLAYRQRQYLQARIFLERAYQIVEPSPTMLFLLARTEAQLGNIAKSGEYRSQLLRMYPRSEEALAIDQSGIN